MVFSISLVTSGEYYYKSEFRKVKLLIFYSDIGKF